MSEWAPEGMPECESQRCRTRPRRHVVFVAFRRPASMHAPRRAAAAAGGAALAVARPSPNLTTHLTRRLHHSPSPPNPTPGVPFTWGSCLDETHSAVAHAIAPSFVSFLAKLIVAQRMLTCVDVIVMRVSNDGEVGSGACRGARPLSAQLVAQWPGRLDTRHSARWLDDRLGARQIGARLCARRLRTRLILEWPRRLDFKLGS